MTEVLGAALLGIIGFAWKGMSRRLTRIEDRLTQIEAGLRDRHGPRSPERYFGPG